MPPRTGSSSSSSTYEVKNPLFLGWVEEMLDEARRHNSMSVKVLWKAYNSLKACPLKINHPRQLTQLKFWGDGLYHKIEERLRKHCLENGLPPPTKRNPTLQPSVPQPDGQSDDEEEEEVSAPQPAKKTRKPKRYVPGHRTGAYALLVGLAQDGTAPGGVPKEELVRIAQPFSDVSMTVPTDAGGFYTGWNSISTLLKRELVYISGHQLKKYLLTQEGWDTYHAIMKAENPTGPAESIEEFQTLEGIPSAEIEENIPPQTSQYADVVKSGGSASASALPAFRPIRIPQGAFKVELVLDVREIRTKRDREYMRQQLSEKGVVPMVRSLDLGDAIWVAKCHDKDFLARTGAQGDEVVLDYIVERKRLDDLIGSIKDGRFHEQKWRLKRSGVKNVIYVIEEKNIDDANRTNYDDAMRSAIASSQAVDGFFLKKTKSMDDSIQYLVRMTSQLKMRYEGKSLFVIPTEVITTQNYRPLLKHLREKDPVNGHYISYPAFASLASKNEVTQRDLYLKMLMCTKFVTGEKALEIQKQWPTPYSFVKAFEECGVGEEGRKRKREMVSGELGALFGRKRIGKALSQKIAEVWSDT